MGRTGCIARKILPVRIARSTDAYPRCFPCHGLALACLFPERLSSPWEILGFIGSCAIGVAVRQAWFFLWWLPTSVSGDRRRSALVDRMLIQVRQARIAARAIPPFPAADRGFERGGVGRRALCDGRLRQLSWRPWRRLGRSVEVLRPDPPTSRKFPSAERKPVSGVFCFWGGDQERHQDDGIPGFGRTSGVGDDRDLEDRRGFVRSGPRSRTG